MPLTGLLLSVLLLGERIDPSLALGTACIATGITVTLLGRARSTPNQQGNTTCVRRS